MDLKISHNVELKRSRKIPSLMEISIDSCVNKLIKGEINIKEILPHFGKQMFDLVLDRKIEDHKILNLFSNTTELGEN